MLEIGTLLFVFWAISTLLTYVIVRDIAAPVMFVHAGVGVYFSDLYFRNYSFEIYFIFLLLVIVPTVVSFIYFGKNINRPIINIQLDVPAKVNKKDQFLAMDGNASRNIGSTIYDPHVWRHLRVRRCSKMGDKILSRTWTTENAHSDVFSDFSSILCYHYEF